MTQVWTMKPEHADPSNPDYNFDGIPTLKWWLPYEVLTDVDPEKFDAKESFILWQKLMEEKYPNGLIPLRWGAYLEDHGKIEYAPYSYSHDGHILDTWLTCYDGPPINWLKCPIEHKGEMGYVDFNFVQLATGFHPAPLQPYVYLPSLVQSLKID